MVDPGSQPLVSIVIPVYNGADYLSEAIDSALSQTWSNIEVLVVDDGSDDDGATASVANGYGDRIRYFYKPNGGVASALNNGIREMRGDYFSWLSHDDVYAHDKVEKQIKALMDLGEPAMAFGDFSTIDADGKTRREFSVGHGFDEEEALFAVLENRISGCGTLIHRRCLEVCGMFHPGLPSTQDYDLWFRIVSRFRLVHVPGTAVYHRLHEGQGSSQLRHQDEAKLLWLSILDRVSGENVPTERSCELTFLGRMAQAHPFARCAPLRSAVEREVSRRLSDKSIMVVIPGKPDLNSIAGIGLRHGGKGPTMDRMVVARTSESDINCLRIDWNDSTQTVIELGDDSGEQPVLSLLTRCLTGSDSDYVWLLADGETEGYSPGIMAGTIAAADDVVACVPEYPVGHDYTGDMGPLDGAMFDRIALQRALAHGSGTITSLIHSLARLGNIVSVPVAGRAREMEPMTGEPASTPPGPAPGSRTRSILAHLSMILVRRPALAGLAWRLMRMLCRSRAQQLLYSWSGVKGYIDPSWYCRAYPDVPACNVDPVFHYLVFGYLEGRDPSPYFSSNEYVHTYPEVARQKLNPLQHFVQWGQSLGYRPVDSTIGESPPERPDDRPAILLVVDNRSRQNEDLYRFTQALTGQVARRLRTVFLCGQRLGTMVFGSDPGGRQGWIMDPRYEMKTLQRLVVAHKVQRALVFRFSGFDGALRSILEDLNVPFDLVAYDDELVPGVSTSTTVNEDTLQRNNEPWRAEEFDRLWLVKHAQNILACSRDLARRLEGSGIGRHATVLPPPDPDRLREFRPWPRPVYADDPLRILLPGEVSEGNGRRVLIEVSELAMREALPLRFVVAGRVDPPLPPSSSAGVRLVSPSGRSGLTDLIVSNRFHLAWFPFELPISCSYALTDAEGNGLPIAATAIGEVVERLESRPLTWLMPANTDAREWLALFMEFHTRGFGTDVPDFEPFDYVRTDVDAYRRYLYERTGRTTNLLSG